MYDNSIEAYKTASRLKPINPDPYFKLGLAYRDNKSYQRAANSFEKAAQLKRRYHEAHYELGMIYYRNIKNNSKALYHFKKVLAIKPLHNNADQIQNLINLLKKK